MKRIVVESKEPIKGLIFGSVQIISNLKAYKPDWHDPKVKVKCLGCNAIKQTSYYNLTSGKSKGCQRCSQPRHIPKWLDRRLTAAKQRCENTSAPEYFNYGARGIRFAFESVLQAGLYVLENLGVPERILELDRIDNNKSYEPGNLRWATRKENVANRRITIMPNWNPNEWPYAYTPTVRMLSSGMTREQIFEAARLAVTEKRKNWRNIKAKLDVLMLQCTH